MTKTLEEKGDRQQEKRNEEKEKKKKKKKKKERNWKQVKAIEKVETSF